MFRRHARGKPIVTFLNKLNYESLYVNIDMILNSKLQFSKSVYLMLKSFNFIPCLSFRQGFYVERNNRIYGPGGSRMSKKIIDSVSELIQPILLERDLELV